MRTKEFSPQRQPKDGKRIGVVLMNHGGATVGQDHGRDARDLADRLGLSVLAVERPGSGGFVPNRQLARDISMPYGYQRAMRPVGRNVSRWAQERELAHLVLVGRSAGALGVLALAASGTVDNQEAVFAPEPLGFETMTLEQGAAHLRRYKLSQKVRQAAARANPANTLVLPEKPRLNPLAGAVRKVRNAVAHPYDKYHHQAVWASNAGWGYASYLARYMPEVDINIEFAADSLSVTNPEAFAKRAEQTMALRDAGGAPFWIGQIGAYTTHASYDNRGFMFARMLPTFERLDYAPPQEPLG